jgi:hypothetical protein
MITRRNLLRKAPLVPVVGAIMLAPKLAAAATNFLEAPGTNGYIAAPFNFLSTELNTLANGAAATSSVGGSSGVFSQSNTVSAIFGAVYFVSGGSFTPNVAAADLAGWFLVSPDGGSTFETATASPSNTVLAMSRPADFIIPLSAAAYATGNIALCAGGYVQLPWGSFKVLLQNYSGVSFPATGNLIKVGPVAIQY